jgi:pSer/pThr/pTyr-binding forkhead associated (FHA) protein
MPLTLLIRSPDGTEQREPLTSELTLGRAQECSVVLTAGGVSRRHARLYLKDGRVWLEDLGSSNGTYLDGARVERPTRVASGGRIKVGDYELSVAGTSKSREDDAAAGPVLELVERPARPSALGKPPPKEALAIRPRRSALLAPATGTRWVLNGMSGPSVGQSYPVSGRMLVGRVPPAVILVDDGSVSRRHAELELAASGVVVRDLGSANGTRVNGQPVQGEALIKDEDVVAFGLVEFEISKWESPVGLVVDASGPRSRGRKRVRRTGAHGLHGLKAGLFLFSVVMVVLVLVAGLWKVLSAGEARRHPAKEAKAVDVKPRVEALLAECRSFTEWGHGAEPSWEQGERACNRALALDPINRAAAEQL